MKTSAGLLGIIVTLSVAMWTVFYILAAGDPLSPPETLVVVGICAAGVFVARWAFRRIRGGRDRDADHA